MESFLQRHQDSVTGVLSGFDRLRFRGTLRLLANVAGLGRLLAFLGILLKDFGDYVEAISNQLAATTEQRALELTGRKVHYIASPSANKEQIALQIARERQVKTGLIAILSCVELCNSFDLYRNRQTRMLELRPARRKCLHYYHYYLHPLLGLMHVRVQSWLPLNLWVCCNGREWLARQLNQAGIACTKRDNCFTEIADLPQAQALMDQQLSTDWPGLLNGLAQEVNPILGEVFARRPLDYYWSVEESEWASDVMFQRPQDLQRLYPRLVHYGMQNLSCTEVLRFLGKRLRQDGTVPGNVRGEMVSDLRPRVEGLRMKHRLEQNWVKLYDKQQRVLRFECVINNPHPFKVYRAAEGDEAGEKSWRYLRKGVADLQRRAEVSQAANDRYAAALAQVEAPAVLGELAGSVCRRVLWKERSVRALNVYAPEDLALLTAVNRGEFLLNGFRNGQLRQVLYGAAPEEEAERKRQSAKVTRQIRLLRGHGLLKKASRSHRYHLTAKGREVISAILAARDASTASLTKAA